MSCFGGKMREYSQISIDRFDNFKGNLNMQSTLYFLSHFHKDHTVGLSSEGFAERLKLSRRVYVYCTEVTKILMLADDSYKHLMKYVKTLEVDVPTRVVIPDEYTDKDEYITVTLIPAGHCPGSVMFLFEGSEGTVLYTGDFRWEGDEVTRVPWFRSGDSVKDIQSLYIDTTFCIPEAFYIPSRESCVEALYDVVKDWIAESPNNYVNISSKTSFGHEHLLKGVADKLGTKIHILPDKFQLYEKIAELGGVFTADPSETQIHACWWKAERDIRSRLPCGYAPPGDVPVRVITIRPSTMWFTQGVQIKDIHVKTGHLHRVCYSFHSSFSEVRDLVTYLKPRRAYPNVKPMNNTMDQVQSRLNMFISMTHKQHITGEVTDRSKPLGILRKVKSTELNNESFSDSEELCFDVMETPRKKRQMGSAESIHSRPGSGVKFSLKYSEFAKERTPENSQDRNSDQFISPGKASDVDILDAVSSYTPSHNSDGEMDLTASDDEDQCKSDQGEITELEYLPQSTGSLTYISGDEDDDDLKEFISQNKLIESVNECADQENGDHLVMTVHKINGADNSESKENGKRGGDKDFLPITTHNQTNIRQKESENNSGVSSEYLEKRTVRVVDNLKLINNKSDKTEDTQRIEIKNRKDSNHKVTEEVYLLDMSDADSDVTLPPEVISSGEVRETSKEIVNDSPDEIDIIYSSVPPKHTHSLKKKETKTSVNGSASNDIETCDLLTESPVREKEDNFWSRLQETDPELPDLPDCCSPQVAGTSKRKDTTPGLATPPSKLPKLKQIVPQNPRGIIHSPIRRKVPIAQKVIVVDLTVNDSESDEESCVILSPSKEDLISP